MSATVLLPVFFLPYPGEILELNKHFLLYTLALIALMMWFIQGAIARSFKISRSAFDIYVVAFLGITIISGLLSVDKNLSFMGNYGGIQVGIVPIIMLIVYAFLVTQVFESSRQRLWLLFGLGTGALISGIWFLLDKYGIFSYNAIAPHTPITNLVSLSNSEFSLFLGLVILGALAILSLKKHNIVLDSLAGIVGAVALIIFFSLGFTIGYILLAIGAGILLSFMLTFVSFLRMGWITTTFAFVVLCVMFIFLGTPQLLPVRLPVEVSLGVNTSYEIALETITDSAKQFLFGTGPSTFVYDFSQYRPNELNLNSFAWQIRFAKPFATIPAMLAEIGIVGTLAFAFVVLVVIGFIGVRWIESMGNEKEKPKFTERMAFVYIVAPLWLTILVSMFFLHLSIVLWFVFFTLLAVLSSSLVKGGKPELIDISLKSSPQYVLATSFAVVLLFAGGLVFAVFAGRFYVAEKIFHQARNDAQTPAEAISLVEQAVRFNSKNSRYRVALADAYLNEARNVAGQADASPDLVTTLVKNAIDQARLATDYSPRSVNTWETLARMYENAISFAPGVNIWVSKSYQKVVELEPSNPISHVRLATYLRSEGKLTEAQDHLQKAIALKPDYLDAYLRLALHYENLSLNADGVIADIDTYNKALQTMASGLSYGSNNDAFLFEMGRLYQNYPDNQHVADAERLYQSALLINPNNVNAKLALAVLYNTIGEREAALTWFLEVQKHQPDNDLVNRRIRQLRSILGLE